MPELPKIHRRQREQSGMFEVEFLDLEFSNGEQRQYHRLVNRGFGAVLIVPLIDDQTVLLVREYAAGFHRYELGLPKGRVDEGETPLQAADRELKEEAGFGSRDLRIINQLTLAPTYMSHATDIVLARDLYPQRLPGDEPEELETVELPLADIDQLALRDDVTEGRTIAALYLARAYLGQG